MTRNRKSARDAGAKLEREVAAYLALGLNDDRIERRARNGAKDRGDVGGVRHLGRRVVVEVKNTARWLPGPWLREAEVERGNDDATVGLVVAKRHGHGHPGDQVVLLTLRDLVALLTGERPDDQPTDVLGDCTDHRPRQHRDGRGPWCRTCRRDAAGVPVEDMPRMGVTR